MQHKTDEYTVTIHAEPNCKTETLQALADMMQCLIEQIKSGGLTKRAADGFVCTCPISIWSYRDTRSICGYCGKPRR